MFVEEKRRAPGIIFLGTLSLSPYVLLRDTCIYLYWLSCDHHCFQLDVAQNVSAHPVAAPCKPREMFV